MEIKEIKVLAEKMRIEMTDQELESMAKDFDNILDYISQIKEAKVEDTSNFKPSLKNVYREDVPTNNGGEFTDDILAEAPDKMDSFIKVKKIL